MPVARIIALSLLLLSLACCGCGAIVAITPFFVDLKLADGSIAPPGASMVLGFVIWIPAFLLAVTSGIIWFIVRPEQRVNRARQAEINRLRELALQLYSRWLIGSSAGSAMTSASESTAWRQDVEGRTRQLFAELDLLQRRQLLQLLYDLNLLQGEMAVNLRGVDLQGVDLHDIDLRNAVLVGVNLLRVNLNGARLNGADLRETGVTPEQLASAASVAGVSIESRTENREP